MASIHRRSVRWATHTAQRRAGALDKEVEAAHAVAHRIEKDPRDENHCGWGASEAGGLSARLTRGRRSRLSPPLSLTLGEIEETLDNGKGK